MSRMSLETAIRLSAEVKGGANITKVQRSLQDLAQGSQTTARQMGTLRSATFQYARANSTTIAGIRNSVAAFRGLQEQAKIGSREFTRYGAEIQKLEGKLRGLDGTAQKAGASLGKNLAAGLAAAGVGRALQGITAQAGRFDAELRKAAAIEGGAGSFGVLRKEIEAVAAVAAGTPTEVAELATALSRAGFSAKETTESLAGIVRGAEATSVSFAEMGSIAADNMRAFGLQTAETGRVVDILTQTANKSNQTVLDLGESMKYAAPIARTLGVPIDDLAGALGLLANNGIRGSDAGTALRTGLTRLQIAAGGADSEVANLTRGNAQLTKAMTMLGSSILDTSGKLKPMDQVLIGLKRSFAGLSTTDQAILSKALFGTEAGSKFQALLNSTEGDINSMFEATRNAGGVAEETRKNMEGFDFSIKRLGGNIESLTNQIGGMIGGALKPLIDGLNTAIGASQKLPEPVKAIGAAAAAAGISVLGLVAAVAAIKATLAVVGGLTAIMGALSASLTVVTGAATAAWAAITGPVGLAVLAIAGVTAAAYAMIPPFRQFVDEIPGRFKIFWRELWQQGEESFAQIGRDLEEFKGQFSRFVTAIGDMVPEPVQKIAGEVQKMAGWLAGIADQIRQAFFNTFAGVENRFRDMVFSIVDNSNPLFAMLRAMGVSVSEAAFKAGTVPIRTGGTGGRGVSPGAFGPSGAAPPAPILPPSTGGAAGAGSGGADGDSKKKKPESLAAKIAKSLAQALDLTPAQAAGVVGNLMRESALNPRINEGGAVGAPRGVGGYGLAQWTGSRQQDLVRFAGGPAAAGDMQTQLRFMVSELMGPESRALESLRKAGSPEEAAAVFDRDYERSGVKALPERKAHARRVYSELTDGNPSAGLDDFADQLRSAAELKKAKEEQRQVAKDLLATEENRLTVLRIADPLQRQIAESRIKELTIADEYAKRIAKSKGVEETRSLELARQNALQSNALELENSITDLREEALKPLANAVEESGNRLAYEREYGGLLSKGINPELAKQYMEIDRIAAASKATLETQIARLETITAELPIDSQLRKSLEDQVRLKRVLLGLVPAQAAQAKSDVTETAEVVAKRERDEKEATDRADRIKGLYKDIASTIEDGIVGAIQTGIDGLIDGTQRLDEALKEILSGVLRDIANQLLRFAVNTALKATGLPFADGGVFGGGSVTPFANGGVVNEPTMFKFAQGGAMQNGLMGEAGPEAIMPLRRGPDGRLGVEASGMAVPFQSTPAAAPNDLAVPFQGAAAPTASGAAAPSQTTTAAAASLAVPFMKSGNSSPAAMAAEAARAMASTPLEPIKLQVESRVINGVEYVTTSQLREATEAAAMAGRDSAYDGMRNNPSIQRSLGMR